MPRPASLLLTCAAGVVFAFWLAGYRTSIPIGDRHYKGFLADSAAAGQPALRLIGDYSKIEIPNTFWRPLRIEVTLRPAASVTSSTAVTLSVDDAPAGSIAVDGEVVHEFIERDRPRGPVLSVQFRAPSAGDARRVGVASVRVTPILAGIRPFWAAAGGLFTGFLVWTSAIGTTRRRRSIVVIAALATLCVALGAAVVGGALLPGLWGLVWAWTGESVIVAGLLLALLLPGWCVVDFLRDRAGFRTLPDAPAVLSVPVTIAILGVLLLALQPARAGAGAFGVLLGTLYAACAGLILLDRSRRMRAAQDLVQYRWVVIMPALVSICAICYLGVGHATVGELTHWTQPAYRNLHDLPGDNELSWLASETWRRHLRANALFYSIWRIGDRGPLYAAVHSALFRALQPDAPTFAAYTRLGIVLNTLYIGPLLLWLSAIFERRIARAIAILVALNPWMFLNVYYTWPKLFGAYFLIGALYLLWRRPAPQSVSTFAAAGLLGGLSGLAHAGSLLTLPPLYGITLALSVRSGRVLLRSLALPAIVVLTLAPWQAYKNRYSPETYNLFYMHYLDEREYFAPLGHNVGRFFAEHPPREQLAVRASHVAELWWKMIDFRVIGGFWRGADVGGPLYALEFNVPWYSAGLLWGVWLVVALPIAMVPRFRPSTGSGRPERVEGRGSPAQVSVTAAAVFVAVSLTVNEALRWRPPTSHELPYTELVMLAALILVALARCGTFWLFIAAAGILARQVYYFTTSVESSVLPLPLMDRFGVLFWLTIAFLVWLSWRDAAPSAPSTR